MAEEIPSAERDETGSANVDADCFTCQNCGGTLSFDIKTQKYMCRSCRTEYDIKTITDSVSEYDFNEYSAREKATVPYTGASAVSCQNCGAEISFTEYQFASVCPMCSSTQIISEKVKSRIAPEGIVPFKVDKQDAQQRFRVWAKTRWFAPNDFKKGYGEGGLKGMYLPFWTFDSDAVSYYTGMGGRHRIVQDGEGKTHMETDWYPVSGVVKDTFDDVLVCSSDKEKLINGILPYRTTTGSVPYSAAYLSGYYAEIYKLRADSCFETAKAIMEQRLTSLAMAQIQMRYDEARVTSMSTKHYNVKYKNMLLPLWGSVFGYKDKKYVYLINGETGKVSGERPYSIPKIVAAVIAGIIMLTVIYMLTQDNSSYYGYADYNEQNYAAVAIDSDYFEYSEGEIT